MNPILFEIPGWGPINSYGTMILLGGMLAMPGVYWDLRSRGMGDGRPGTMLLDIYIVLVLGAAVGGRILHVLTAPGSYLDDPSRLWAMDGTGFVFFGSMLAIMAGFAWVARRYGTTFGRLCDAGATWMPLGHAGGRMGCLLAGCCWGAPTDVPWAIELPPESVAFGAGEVPRAAHATVPLHPTQLYEHLGLLALFAVLLLIRRRNGIETPWRQASRYALGYGLLRFVIEMFRGDPSRGFLFEARSSTVASWLALPPDQPLLLSVSQGVSLALIALGVYGLRRTAASPDPEGPSPAP